MTWSVVADPKSATPPPPLPTTPVGDHRVVIPVPLTLGPLQYDTGESVQAVAQPTTSLPPPGPTPVRMNGGIGKGFPATLDFYPPSSIRLGEEGLTAVSVCVDDHGRLTTDPKVAVSSGSPRLDGGALALARAGSGPLPQHDRERPGYQRLLSGWRALHSQELSVAGGGSQIRFADAHRQMR